MSHTAVIYEVQLYELYELVFEVQSTLCATYFVNTIRNQGTATAAESVLVRRIILV